MVWLPSLVVTVDVVVVATMPLDKPDQARKGFSRLSRAQDVDDASSTVGVDAVDRKSAKSVTIVVVVVKKMMLPLGVNGCPTMNYALFRSFSWPMVREERAH